MGDAWISKSIARSIRAPKNVKRTDERRKKFALQPKSKMSWCAHMKVSNKRTDTSTFLKIRKNVKTAKPSNPTAKGGVSASKEAI